MAQKKLRLSPSKVEKFLQCREQYRLYYEEGGTGIEPRTTKKHPLQIGIVVHDLIHKYNVGTFKMEDLNNLDEIIQKDYPGNTPEDSRAIAVVAASLFNAWVQKQAENTIKVVCSEIHLETEEPDFFIYHRVDSLGRTQDGKLWRVERKTTARLDSYYLSGLKSGLQTGICYHVLKKTLKEKVHGTMFELLVKVKDPYCAIQPVGVSQPIIERGLKTFQGVARDIMRGDFYPDAGACFQYGGECEYLALCNNPTKSVLENFYKPKEPIGEKPKEEPPCKK